MKIREEPIARPGMFHLLLRPDAQCCHHPLEIRSLDCKGMGIQRIRRPHQSRTGWRRPLVMRTTRVKDAPVLRQLDPCQPLKKLRMKHHIILQNQNRLGPGQHGFADCQPL